MELASLPQRKSTSAAINGLQDQSNHEERLKIAQQLFENQDFDIALDIFRELADSSEADPQVRAIANYQLAVSYHHEIGVTQNLEKAAQYYCKAAEYEHPDAAGALESIFNRNPSPQAGHLSSHATSYGAQTNLSSLVISSDEEAYLAFANGSSNDEPLPQQYQSHSPFPSDHYGGRISSRVNVQHDTEFKKAIGDVVDQPTHQESLDKANELLQSSQFNQAHGIYSVLAKQNIPEAKEANYQLGWMYANGLGVIKDSQMAITYLERAADLGYLRAYHVLGDIHFESNNYEHSYSCYQMAVKEKKLQATQIVWLSLAAEHLQKESYEAAHSLYSILADNGNVEALARLGLMYSKGIGVPKNDATAMSYLAKACRTADSKKDSDITHKEHECLAQAAYLLGELALAQKNNENALKWYDFADRHGNQEAGIKMARIHMNPGFLEPARPKELMECLDRSLAKGNIQAAREFVYWYQNRSFFASKISDRLMKAQAANFYVRAGEPVVPPELRLETKKAANNFDNNL